MSTLIPVHDAVVSATAYDEEPLTILVLAAGHAAEEAARAIEQHCRASVKLIPDHLACLQVLQGGPVTLLVVEESVATADPAAMEAVYQAAGPTVVLEVNLGITDAQRFVRQVRSALRQRQREKERARASVREELRQELSVALTGLLLESQLALRQAGPQLAPTLQRLVGLAEHVCDVLREAETEGKMVALRTGIQHE